MDRKLYIPLPIRKRKEYAKGIGKEELLKIGAAAAAGLCVSIPFYAASGSIYILAVMPSVALLAGVMLFQKDSAYQSMADKIRHWRRFVKSQKVFYYKYESIYEKEAGTYQKQRKE